MNFINQIKEHRYDEGTIIQIKKSLHNSLFADRRKAINILTDASKQKAKT